MVFSTGEEAVIQEISGQVLIEAYSKIGYDVEIKLFPNARAPLTANTGRVDGEISRIKGINKKFGNLIRVPIAVNYLEGYAFAKKTDTMVSNWEDLKKYKVICVRGVKFVEENMAKRNITCNDVTFFTQAVKMLQRGRGEIAIFPKVNGISAIREANISDVKAVGKPLIKVELYHYLHKKHIGIVSEIRAALTEMEKSGRIAEIRKEYIKTHNF